MQIRKNILVRIVFALIRRIRHIIVLAKAAEMSEFAIGKGTSSNLLVLCYGNIYRSPLVEYLLRKSIDPSKTEIKSAGFYEKINRPCDSEYLKLLSKRGYDLAAHRSSRVTIQDTQWADLIVIMDRKNWDMLMALDKSVKTKVVWIGAFTADVRNEVEDPYGMHQGDVNKVVDQIELCVADLANRISGNTGLLRRNL
jgi:protein-tyrosine phosphatase